MNFKEKLSPSAQKKLSDLLFIFYAGGAALLSYSLVYASQAIHRCYIRRHGTVRHGL